jgi:hypothetical protein
MEILKTINRSEFVNLFINLHHGVCKAKTKTISGTEDPSQVNAAWVQAQDLVAFFCSEFVNPPLDSPQFNVKALTKYVEAMNFL